MHPRVQVTSLLVTVCALAAFWPIAADAQSFILQWGSQGSGDGQFEFPVGVATDAAGNVYVADAGNSRIQKFTSSGVYLTQWGSGGGGLIDYPWSLATDAAGNVFVVDLDIIQEFTSTGTYLTQWGSDGFGAGQFRAADGVATDPAGNVYVAEDDNNRIQRFTNTGAYVTQWATHGSGGSGAKCLAIDAAANVYVGAGGDHIEKYTSTGTLLTQWGAGQFLDLTGVGDRRLGQRVRCGPSTQHDPEVHELRHVHHTMGLAGHRSRAVRPAHRNCHGRERQRLCRRRGQQPSPEVRAGNDRGEQPHLGAVEVALPPLTGQRAARSRAASAMRTRSRNCTGVRKPSTRASRASVPSGAMNSTEGTPRIA